MDHKDSGAKPISKPTEIIKRDMNASIDSKAIPSVISECCESPVLDEENTDFRMPDILNSSIEANKRTRKLSDVGKPLKHINIKYNLKKAKPLRQQTNFNMSKVSKSGRRRNSSIERASTINDGDNSIMKLLKVNLKDEDFTYKEKRCEVFKDLLEQYQQEDLLTHKSKISKKLNTDLFHKPRIFGVENLNVKLTPFVTQNKMLN